MHIQKIGLSFFLAVCSLLAYGQSNPGPIECPSGSTWIDYLPNGAETRQLELGPFITLASVEKQGNRTVYHVHLTPDEGLNLYQSAFLNGLIVALEYQFCQTLSPCGLENEPLTLLFYHEGKQIETKNIDPKSCQASETVFTQQARDTPFQKLTQAEIQEAVKVANDLCPIQLSESVSIASVSMPDDQTILYIYQVSGALWDTATTETDWNDPRLEGLLARQLCPATFTKTLLANGIILAFELYDDNQKLVGKGALNPKICGY